MPMKRGFLVVSVPGLAVLRSDPIAASLLPTGPKGVLVPAWLGAAVRIWASEQRLAAEGTATEGRGKGQSGFFSMRGGVSSRRVVGEGSLGQMVSARARQVTESRVTVIIDDTPRDACHIVLSSPVHGNPGDPVVTRCDDAARELFGAAKGSGFTLEGTRLSRLIPEPWTQAHSEMMEAAIIGHREVKGIDRRCVFLRTLSGDVLPATLHVSDVRGNPSSPRELFAVAIDVTRDVEVTLTVSARQDGTLVIDRAPAAPFAAVFGRAPDMRASSRSIASPAKRAGKRDASSDSTDESTGVSLSDYIPSLGNVSRLEAEMASARIVSSGDEVGALCLYAMQCRGVHADDSHSSFRVNLLVARGAPEQALATGKVGAASPKRPKTGEESHAEAFSASVYTVIVGVASPLANFLPRAAVSTGDSLRPGRDLSGKRIDAVVFSGHSGHSQHTSAFPRRAGELGTERTYVLVERVGEGSFAEVWSAAEFPNESEERGPNDGSLLPGDEPGDRVEIDASLRPSMAVKVIDKHKGFDDDDMASGTPEQKAERLASYARTLDAEIEVLRAMSDPPHANLSTLHFAVETPNDLMLGMPLFYMSLRERLLYLRDDCLDYEATRSIAKGVLMGLREMHRRGFCHRDVKPGNVMFRVPEGEPGCDVPVLIDFGISTRIPPAGSVPARESREDRPDTKISRSESTGSTSASASSGDSESSTSPRPVFHEHSDAYATVRATEIGEGLLGESVGTAQFASPQVLDGHLYSGTRNDAWSCGCLVWMMATGNMFGDPGSASVMGYLDETIAALPEDMADFVRRALEPDQWKRASVDELLQTEFIRIGRDQ